jgi:hypothetical protein
MKTFARRRARSPSPTTLAELLSRALTYAASERCRESGFVLWPSTADRQTVSGGRSPTHSFGAQDAQNRLLWRLQRPSAAASSSRPGLGGL